MAITPARFVLPPLSPLTPVRQTQPSAPASADFAAVLRDALGEVNRALLDSEQKDRLLAQGKLSNVHDAVIAAEKAGLALELTVQIRNRILEAYQEIMRMNV